MSKPIVPRYYQWEALKSFLNFFELLRPCVKSNACGKMPPGTGKSLVFAMLIKELYERWGVRLILLCNSAELVKQDFNKACEYWPEGKHLFGINADKLGQRDYDSQIIFATIQSVAGDPSRFFKKNKQPFNMALVDEAHAIPEGDDGQFLDVFDVFLSYEEDFRVAGLTASDWRLATGRICKPKNVLTHMIYEYPVMQAINDGAMAAPVNKNTKYKVGHSKLVVKGGEFTEKSVNEVYVKQGLIEDQVEEMIRTTEEEERSYWIVNCFGIVHADAVFKEIQKRGIDSSIIHSNIKGRDDIIAKYRAMETTAIVQVNMLSTGIDFPHADFGVLLCPTFSSAKYYQQVGRLLRPTPIPCPTCGEVSYMIEDHCQFCKGEILRTYVQSTGYILCQSGNVAEHGAINGNLASPDKSPKKKKKHKDCKECGEGVAFHIMICPWCGALFIKKEIERENKTLRKASHDTILAIPEWLDVEDHQFFVSVKKGVIQHHLFLKDNVKVTNRLELGSSDPLKNKKAKQHLSKLLNGDIPKTVESFVDDGYREKVPCPVQVLVTQQTGFRRLEDYRFKADLVEKHFENPDETCFECSSYWSESDTNACGCKVLEDGNFDDCPVAN